MHSKRQGLCHLSGFSPETIPVKPRAEKWFEKKPDLPSLAARNTNFRKSPKCPCLKEYRAVASKKKKETIKNWHGCQRQKLFGFLNAKPGSNSGRGRFARVFGASPGTVVSQSITSSVHLPKDTARAEKL